jgi:phosphohistidine phosphatase SixA
MVVGHNPTFESLVELLVKDNFYATMPTAAVASILFNMDNWDTISKKSGKLEWLIRPKELMG